MFGIPGMPDWTFSVGLYGAELTWPGGTDVSGGRGWGFIRVRSVRESGSLVAYVKCRSAGSVGRLGLGIGGWPLEVGMFPSFWGYCEHSSRSVPLALANRG